MQRELKRALGPRFGIGATPCAEAEPCGVPCPAGAGLVRPTPEGDQSERARHQEVAFSRRPAQRDRRPPPEEGYGHGVRTH